MNSYRDRNHRRETPITFAEASAWLASDWANLWGEIFLTLATIRIGFLRGLFEQCAAKRFTDSRLCADQAIKLRRAALTGEYRESSEVET